MAPETEPAIKSPAEQAAEKALEAVYACLADKKSFLLEAGAGAGKTYSLIKALNYLIEREGPALIRKHQQIACITYTNVACDEIKSRTDRHPAVCASTIHAFCWALIKDFQPVLKEQISQDPDWQEKLTEAGGLGVRPIEYELGYRAVEEKRVLISHDDVLTLTVGLMSQPKFCHLFTSRFPILFIDEYQDTNKEFAEAIKTSFLDTARGPLIGFFGDHWQKIYGDGCGKIEHAALRVIDKEANFRSAPAIVDALNRLRPELKQAVSQPEAEGSVVVFHTNGWGGERLKKNHWQGDLPPDVAHESLVKVRAQLVASGWDFSPGQTKILMLTHNVLAREQGYSGIAEVFQGRNEKFAKKEDRHIEFLVDVVEPLCAAYENKRFGEMFSILGATTSAIKSRTDKLSWVRDMDELLRLRASASIGDVIEHLKLTGRPHLSDSIERREWKLGQPTDGMDEKEIESLGRVRKLKTVPYQQVITLAKFIDEKTLFSTKHGVKGAEFENVLVVFGRGWNHYDFNLLLEWLGGRDLGDKQEAFERNRNLFYVACSRPKKRLALLFTQLLSDQAMTTLADLFVEANIRPIA